MPSSLSSPGIAWRRSELAARSTSIARAGDEGTGGTLTALYADLQRGSDAAHHARGDGRGASGRIAAGALRIGSSPIPQRRCVDSRNRGRSTGCGARQSVMPVWYRRRWRNVRRANPGMSRISQPLGGRYAT